VTGTILAGSRTCHTKAERAQIDSANQDAAEQARRARRSLINAVPEAVVVALRSGEWL
jgi:hypothetical protein